jgi:hypothetical protein
MAEGTAMGTKLVHRQYYIVPWSPCDDPGIAITKASYRRKENCTICDPAAGNALSGVEDDATLLIDGHGTTDDPLQISAQVGQVMATRSAVALATLISEFWKLPKTHVKIRMLSCHGVGFARNFAVALGGRKYNSIVVAGYLHNVSTGGGRSSKTGRGTNAMVVNDEFRFKGDEGFPENQRIAWFNHRGEQVAKPVFEKKISVTTDEYG